MLPLRPFPNCRKKFGLYGDRRRPQSPDRSALLKTSKNYDPTGQDADVVPADAGGCTGHADAKRSPVPRLHHSGLAYRRGRLKSTHRPERTCIACGTKARKSTLIRIAYDSQICGRLGVAANRGGVQIDHKGSLPGRGAYLCQGLECDRMLLRPGRLSYALQTSVSESEMDILISELNREGRPQGSTKTS